MPRIKKAWSCRVRRGDGVTTVYAPTAGKARYQFKIDISDPCPDIEFMDIIVRRNRHDDIELPDEHRLVSELTEKQRHIISHAYGGGSRLPGYRDHYCTAPGDMHILRLTHEFGLFDGPHGEEAYGESPRWSGAFFYLTDLGKQVARSMLPEYPR